MLIDKVAALRLACALGKFRAPGDAGTRFLQRRRITGTETGDIGFVSVERDLAIDIRAQLVTGITACAVDQNTGNGISADSGSSLLQNAASFNTLAGIITFSGCTVANCNANQNGGDGIRVGYGCLVSQNNAFGNGGSVTGSAGIHAANSGNRIDGNVSSSNTGTGILSDGGTNSDITVRNNCSTNSVVHYNPANGATFGGVSITANSAGAWSNF